MSGPITVLLCPQSLTVLLAASAILAARAVHESHAEAAVLQREHETARRADGQRQTDASLQGLAALQAQADAAEQRLAQLAGLSQRLAGGAALELARPQRPQNADYAALADYVRAIEAFDAQARHVLMTAAASRPPDDGDLNAFALPDALAQSAPATPSARLVQRIAHLGPVPAMIAAVAAELDAAHDPARAELLASELRRHIQLHAEDALQAQVQRAQALVVEQSLCDLGYQVDGIDATLFVEGGVAHFRKRHWGDYMVRMRVAGDGERINFNVVRVAGDGDAEASVADRLAEDRWCAEFPALMKALAARGIALQVTRRLEAGELPVQRVERDHLPVFADEDAASAAAAPQRMARPLP